MTNKVPTREEVSDWLRANGVNPSRTPIYCEPSISDGRLTILQVLWPIRMDPLNPGFPATETITVSIVEAPTPAILSWIAEGEMR